MKEYTFISREQKEKESEIAPRYLLKFSSAIIELFS